MKTWSLFLTLLGILVLATGCGVRSDAPAASIETAGVPTLLYFYTEG
ncbi:MAG: hypothetical protein KJ065_19665 [Anaerolineae bacterium]|nr:hypothetical protein [Anaerolineae bacterium]